VTCKPRHIPLRRCVICRASRPKDELVRWIRTAQGVVLDGSGKSPGRGAYICRSEPCLQQALTRKGVERVLGGRPSPSEIETMLAACRPGATAV
jgi:predicted RNA-binding protein YlxR (DUF448 family)